MTTTNKARFCAPTPASNEEGPWSRDPRQAFRDWLAGEVKDDGRPFSAASARVYCAMWSTFVDQLAARRGHSPARADQDDLRDFLDHAPACRRAEARARYVLLLRRAFAAMAEELPGRPNPAEAAFLLRERRAPDQPMPFLPLAERARLFATLAEPTDFGDPAGRMLGRSKALCALMLGAGFKPGQARLAPVTCVQSGPERFVTAPQLGQITEHRCLVDARAWPAIDAWLARHPGGELLFPGRGADGRPIDYARAFIGVKALLGGIGVGAGGERASPQTLRNSYGAGLIEQGCTIDAVREYMGFARLEFAHRFIAAHTAWARRMAP